MNNLFDLTKSIAGEEIKKFEFPWQAVPEIPTIINKLINALNKEDYIEINKDAFIHKTCVINKNASVTGPCIICKGSEIRQAAFIRGNVIVGENCVIGNSCELKNSIVFNDTQIPHFNYIGDSIIGYKAHFGAGAITSNLKSDRTLVSIKDGEKIIKTNLKKLGALIGDGVEIGCNSVLNPGTVVGKNTIIYPLSFVRGVIKENSIYKNKNEIVDRK